MQTTRRSFMQTAATTGAALGLGSLAAAQETQPTEAPPQKAKKKLNMLILGGTGFLGPAIVEQAVARGHSMTLFNRGRTNPQLFPDLEKLRGDRDEGDLSALEGRQWDIVIDTSAYVPGHAEASAKMVAEGLKQYLLISTVSAFADHATPYVDETAPVAEVPAEVLEKATTMRVLFAEYVQHYGGMKALCEQAVENVLPGKTTNIRPGLIVGPRDRSDRFTYWPVRVETGGEVLAPGDGSDPVQWIDVRDLAAFTLDCAENGTTGVFSAITPAGLYTMAEMLHGIKASMWTDAKFTWLSNEFLEENEVAAWSHMPVWIPAVDEYAGFHLVDTSKAVQAGLKFRPLAETTCDTLAWVRTLDERRRASLGPDAVYPTPENREDESIIKRRTGLSATREAELLKAWHEHEKKTELPEQYD